MGGLKYNNMDKVLSLCKCENRWLSVSNKRKFIPLLRIKFSFKWWMLLKVVYTPAFGYLKYHTCCYPEIFQKLFKGSLFFKLDI